MEIGSITGGDRATQGTTTRPGNLLGKEQFLSLLMTQLQLQDPFEPLKNEDMIAQLATFSSLEQLQNMNDGLQAGLEMDLILGQLLSNTMATTLIGKEVRVATSSFQRGETGSTELGYRLHGPADQVTISVYDEAGKLVATLAGDGHEAGVHRVEWDGRGTNGDTMPPGNYTFKVEAKRSDGSVIEAQELLVGRVSGIRYKDGVAHALVGETEILMSQIEEIFG